MPICAVRTCGERGRFACKKSEGQIISFHRFPSDQFPRIKAKWIRATGQHKTKYSWQPTKESTICSKHFKKEDFLTCTDLKITAVPISEESLLDDHNEQLQMPSTSSSQEGEEFEQTTDTQYLCKTNNVSQELIDGVMKDSVNNSDTDSAEEIIELPQYTQSNNEFTEEDKDIPMEYEPATTTSPHDQPEGNQPIAILDSDPEFSETSSEIEFTELDSSEAKSSQHSVDAIETTQGSDEPPPYGMKISNAYSTRKRLIVQMKDQIKTNIKMYRIDPATNTVHPVRSISTDRFIDPAKPALIKKPIYLIKKVAESLDGNSQKTKVNQNCSSQVLYANDTKKIAPETDSNSHIRTINKEEKKKVYSTPAPKPAQINQKQPAKTVDDVQKIWKATKLNPTLETTGRVKKHRKLKVNSIIKTINPSAKISLASLNVKMSKPKPTVLRPATPSAKISLASLNVKMFKPKPTVSTPAIPRPTTAEATPADLMSTSTVSTPTSTVSTPSPADSTPTPADSTPSRAYSMSIPADSMATPADSTPTPADSTPIQVDSMLTPADAMPILADSTPIPADSMLTPADSMPIPADSMLTPADSMSTLTVSIPTPAVLSPAVQNLNDCNVSTHDEYDTFAKHVATQLRQLSLESYLSAQGEIQSLLSRYRLCDLNAIKKDHDL